MSFCVSISKARFQARTALTVWNWSDKTLYPGALLPFLDFSSRHFSRPFSNLVPRAVTRLDFPSPPQSAPGSPRMQWNQTLKQGGPIKIRGSEDLHGYCLPLPLPSTMDLSSFFSQVSVFSWKFNPGDLSKIQARLMISKKGSPRYLCWVWGPQFLRVLVFGILLIF